MYSGRVLCGGRRKRIMEGGGSGGKVINNNINNGGEARRIHIVYFLSRLAQVDHPHLIRVHHLRRNGVYLRDVKRWLAEVRGKDMPEAFSWSYKRRYKSGYVWQDLLNDDLITPISDNEYVLKGSESLPLPLPLPCCTSTFDTCNSHDDEKNKVRMLRNDEEAIVVELQEQPACSPTEVKEEENRQLEDPKVEPPRSESHVQEQESLPVYAYAYGSASSERSTLTDDPVSMKHEREDANYNINHINLNKLVPTLLTQESKLLDYSDPYSSTSSYPSFYSGLLNKKKSKKTAESNNNNYYNNKDSIIQKKGTLPSPSSSSSSKSNKKSSSSSSSAQFAKSKSCSNGASNILRNLLKCGAVETKDGVVVNVNRPPVNLPPAVLDTTGDNDRALNLICRRNQQQLGGSARLFATSTSTWYNQHHPQYGARKSFDGTTSATASNNKKKDVVAGPKPVSSAYHWNNKPVGGPTCSQCGKLFKPEKLQKHMKFCKGIKASSKSSTTAVPVSFEKTSSSSSPRPPQSLGSMNLSPQPQPSGQEPSTSSTYLLTN